MRVWCWYPLLFRLNDAGHTPWIKAFHQGQEKKATAIALVTASEPADGTNLPKTGGCFAEACTLLATALWGLWW